LASYTQASLLFGSFAMRLTLPLALAVLLLAAQPQAGHAASATWQWRDAQGNIQFSDRPPPQGIPDKDILKRPPGARLPVRIVSTEAASAPQAPRPVASAPSLSETDRKAQVEESKRLKEEEAQRKAVEASNAKIKAENCKSAQAYLRDLQAGQRVVRTNDKGEREFLDDQQRNAEVARARAIVASDCR
jgi:hypothetical protein